jgi:replicative DNA helicase
MVIPNSSEAEQGVLGSMMIAPDEAIPECIKSLTPQHFYGPAHQTIFNLLVELWTTGIPIELILFTEQLRNRKILDQVGGPSFVTHLAVFVPTAANLDYYIEIVHEKYVLRQLLAISAKAARRTQEDQGEAQGILAEYCEALNAITRTACSKARQSVSELVQEKINRMENGIEEAVVKTGIKELDLRSPLWPSDMPLISGERKVGKSMLASTVTTNVARNGIPVAYFSLEDSVHKLIDRLISGISRVPMTKQISVKSLSESDMKASSDAAIVLSSLPLYLYDDLFDLDHIIAEARQMVVTKRIGLIVVDYAQLIRTPDHKGRNREQEVAHISRSLRLLSLETQIPLLLLSQLNEQGRSRESRALEQDATASWKMRGSDDEEESNMRWIDIEWQRNGESNIKFPVTFLGYCARVENYSEEK